MGQQASKFQVPPNASLPSNKILVIGKGLYALNHPLLVNHHPNSLTSTTLKLSLRDKHMEVIPQNVQAGVIHPVFDFPINTTSFNFQNFNFHLPKLETLGGFTIALFVNYDHTADLSSPPLKNSVSSGSSPSSSSSSSTTTETVGSYETDDQHQQQQQDQQQQQQLLASPPPPTTVTENKPAKSGYLSSLFNAVKNEIVGTVTSEYQGTGFVDLRQLVQEDTYHNITVPIVANNNVVVAKIDLSIVIPGVKTEVFEMRNSMIRNNVQPGQIFNKVFEKIVRDTNNFNQVRFTKQKVEATANRWINSHVTSRIEVVSVDTTHINSNSGYEMFSVQVWYRFTPDFITETRTLEEERMDRVKKAKEEEEQKNRELQVKEEEEQEVPEISTSNTQDDAEEEEEIEKNEPTDDEGESQAN